MQYIPLPTTKQCFLNNSILSILCIPRASDAVTSLCRQQNRETSLPKSLNTSQKIPKIPMSNTCSTSLHLGTPRFRLGKPWTQHMRQLLCVRLRRTTNQHCKERYRTAGRVLQVRADRSVLMYMTGGSNAARRAPAKRDRSDITILSP